VSREREWADISFLVYLCGYYSPTPHCNGQDYPLVFFNLCAIPTLLLFALGQRRIWSAGAVVVFACLIGGLIIPLRANWGRQLASLPPLMDRLRAHFLLV
jgi:hypothetical protein